MIDKPRQSRKRDLPADILTSGGDSQIGSFASAVALPDGAALAPDSGAEAISIDFLMAMLAAVARMALRSTRRQADLQTAMRADRLTVTPVRTLTSARRLEQMGYVRGLLELGDGGILLTVTPDGFDRLRLTAYRDIVEDAHG